jgi:hypothetical protein
MSDDLVKRLRKNVMCGDAEIEEAADRIEKLEAALREIAQTVTIEDESWHPSYNDPRFTQKQAEGLAEALSARINIARKALEGKDENSN